MTVFEKIHYYLARLFLFLVPVNRLLRCIPRSNFRLHIVGLLHYLRPNLSEVVYTNNGETMAYVGFFRSEYVTSLLKAVGPTGHVVLIEAHPTNYNRLTNGLENIPDKEQVTTINVALWHEQGEVPFEVYNDEDEAQYHKISGALGDAYYGNSTKTIQVSCDTFDNIYLKFHAIRHTFVTINGAELEALKGMKNYLGTPGNSVWIKSPFRNKDTGELMYKEVADVLKEQGMKVFIGAKTYQSPSKTMGKVFAYQPF